MIVIRGQSPYSGLPDNKEWLKMATALDLHDRNGTSHPAQISPTSPTPVPATDGETSPEAFPTDETTETVADFVDLLEISLSALNMSPPRYLASIFGKPRTWLPPYRPFSEYRILNLWRWWRMWKYLLNVSIPSLPRNPPTFAPPFIEQFFFQPSVILQRPDHTGSYTNFPEESWFLVNGIMTNDVMAQMNAAFVSYLFHRPVTLIQNSTDSFFYDLAQCMVGKAWRQATEPAIKAFPVIYDALQNPHKRRVVILAHSQGTIIMSNVLRLLYAKVSVPMEALSATSHAPPEFILQDESEFDLGDFAELPLKNLTKLEVYCFATCADQFTYFDSAAGIKQPYIEHFGNENDLVARLGMISPRLGDMPLNVEGQCYVRPGSWGHFLNEHYLYPIMEKQKHGRKKEGDGTAKPFIRLDHPAGEDTPFPRLFRYINGGFRLPVE
jgi:hypothetical protein